MKHKTSELTGRDLDAAAAPEARTNDLAHRPISSAAWAAAPAPDLAALDAEADSIADLCETNQEREQAADLIKALVRRALGVGEVRTSLLTPTLEVPQMPWVLRDGQTVTAGDFGLLDLAQPGYATLRDLTVNQVLDVLRQRNAGEKGPKHG